MTPTATLTELHYLPAISWFAQVMESQEVMLEAKENFQKQTSRNRTTILGPHGTLILTVPVKNGRSSKKILVSDIEIDYSQAWNMTHWRTLVSCYANSPYFQYYAPDLEAILLSKPTTLFELNERMVTYCLKCLGWNKKISRTETYHISAAFNTKDVRSRILADDFIALKKKLENLSYAQVFGKEFVSNLSMIDLLSNLGPDSSDYLKRISQ
ncbi:MAG: WbqC family protein [Cytophagales bacterium]|nr:WbqC family protein [Cytophagales bacterium]